MRRIWGILKDMGHPEGYGASSRVPGIVEDVDNQVGKNIG
jgi:hypothetical protein